MVCGLASDDICGLGSDVVCGLASNYPINKDGAELYDSHHFDDSLYSAQSGHDRDIAASFSNGLCRHIVRQ